MNILSDMDMQIINYFYTQFKNIGSIFCLFPWEGSIIYISIITYIVTFPFSIKNKTNTKSRRTRI